MTLDNNATQTKQTGAVVGTRVNTATKRLEYRHGNQCGKPGKNIALEFLLDKFSDHLGDTFTGLQ